MIEGRCVHCGQSGPAGEPCESAVCRVRKNHFVPLAHASDLAIDDPLIGRVVGGFLVVGVLGSGGFGNVHHVLQLPLRSRPLQGALKRLRPPGSSSTAAKSHQLLIERFESEADALASLSHPNIVRLLKTGLEGDVPYLVLELVADAETLERALEDHRQHGITLPEADTVAIIDQLLNALEAAHEKSIIHRDVKPGNIMLQRVAGYDIFVRVLDFGLAKFIAESSDTQRVMGTLDYMAPEQLRGKDIGAWTDLYALGLLLLAMMTGRSGFSAERAVLINEKLDPDYDPVARATLGGDYDSARLSFLRKATAHDHRQRFTSVLTFRKAFHEAFATKDLRRERKLAPTRELAHQEPEAPRPRAGHRGGEVIRLRPPTRVPEPAPSPPPAPLGVPDTRPAIELGRAPEKPAGSAIREAFRPSESFGRPLAWSLGETPPPAAEPPRPAALPPRERSPAPPSEPTPAPTPVAQAPVARPAPRRPSEDTSADALTAQRRWPLLAEVATVRSNPPVEVKPPQASITSFFELPQRTPPRVDPHWFAGPANPGPDDPRAPAEFTRPDRAETPAAELPRRAARRPYEPPIIRETEGKLASMAAIAATEDSGPTGSR